MRSVIAVVDLILVISRVALSLENHTRLKNDFMTRKNRKIRRGLDNNSKGLFYLQTDIRLSSARWSLNNREFFGQRHLQSPILRVI